MLSTVPVVQAAAVELVDDRGRPDVGRPVHVADLAERPVVDRVRRDAAAVRPHPGHHHHVVGDGLHDRQRAGAREVLPAVAQRLHGRHQAAADLVRPAAVEHQHVARACAAPPSPARSSRSENSTVAPPAPSTLRKVRRSVPAGCSGLAPTASGPHIRHPPACRPGAASGSRSRRRRTRSRRSRCALSARSPITNQSIWTRAGVMSSTEKPWSSKLRYFTCRLFALIVVLDGDARGPRRAAGDVLQVVGRDRAAHELHAGAVAGRGVGAGVVRQLAGPAGVDVAGEEHRVAHARVADVREDLAAVVGVAVPLVGVVGAARRRAADR